MPTHPRAGLHGLRHINNIGPISTTRDYDTDVQDYPDDDYFYPDVDEYAEAPDQRWRPIAAIAAGVLVLAMIATMLIVRGGDSASTSVTMVPPTSRPMIATPHPSAQPSTSLPPETVTTVTPPPSSTPSAAPTKSAQPIPTSSPVVTPHTIVYRVTGTKQLLDFVSIVYTDEKGLPHTEFNVSLPWSKTIVLNAGVEAQIRCRD